MRQLSILCCMVLALAFVMSMARVHAQNNSDAIKDLQLQNQILSTEIQTTTSQAVVQRDQALIENNLRTIDGMANGSHNNTPQTIDMRVMLVHEDAKGRVLKDAKGNPVESSIPTYKSPANIEAGRPYALVDGSGWVKVYVNPKASGWFTGHAAIQMILPK